MYFRQVGKFIVPPEHIPMAYWEGLRHYIKRTYLINVPKRHDKKVYNLLSKLNAQFA